MGYGPSSPKKFNIVLVLKPTKLNITGERKKQRERERERESETERQRQRGVRSE